MKVYVLADRFSYNDGYYDKIVGVFSNRELVEEYTHIH